MIINQKHKRKVAIYCTGTCNRGDTHSDGQNYNTYSYTNNTYDGLNKTFHK